MTGQSEPSPAPVRPVLALALATVTFVALVICGLGITSLVLDADVVETPGLGPFTGIAGTVLAAGAFALSLWMTLRSRARTFWGALWAALAGGLGYVVGVWFGALLGGADPAVAVAVAGRIATSWFGVVVAASGAVSGWGGIALVRTRSSRPRWPWEDEFDE